MLSLSSGPRSRAGRWPVVLIFVATFLFRWLTLDFDNDYFMHVAWAAEMLRGEWPVRDFVEPGFPLQTGLAYLGLRAGGYQLLWEGIIACTLIAAGAVFTYLACVVLGLPRWLAVTAALVAVAAYPRLYAYPKAVAYPAALWALALYASRPAVSTLAGAGVITGAAFLLRHDHGVYAGLATVVGIALYHGRNWHASARAVVAYGAAAALMVAPWLAWVQASGHADQYWAFLTGQSRGLATGQRAPEIAFDIDIAKPWVTLAPVEYPRVGVRWTSGASPDQRREREHRYGLERAGDDDVYALTNTDVGNVRALIQDPVVEDTSGIDRGSLRVPDALFPWTYLQLQQYAPIVRVRVLPGVVKTANAMAWLAWTTFALPGLALAVLGIRAVRGFPLRPETTWVVAAAAVLSAITYQTLVRSSPDSRLGDVAAATGILLAWTAWCAWTVRGAAGILARTVAVVALVLTVASAVSFGRVLPRLAVSGIDGPTNIVRQVRARAERYGARPLDVFAPIDARGLPRVARWLHDCTRDDARVAVLGFEPQVMVIAERGFAGGMAFYDLGWVSSERDQLLIVERWSRQHVPAVVALESEWGSFSRDYAIVRAFIDREYRLARRSAFDGGKEVSVLVKASLTPAGTEPTTGLPCFR